MKHRLTVNNNNKPNYNIYFEEDFSQLPDMLVALNMDNRKLCIVSDSQVAGLYLEQVKTVLSPLVKQMDFFVFAYGEENKNLNTVRDLYEYLILHKYDRNDVLIALGGGVVGDLTGYAAATYLRGVRFIQVPTSLLAMVDSSIGGKTGVDFDSYKNMVGAFHQPQAVYMNLGTLNTLTDKQYYSAFGEIIKYGLIRDKLYYQWLKERTEDIKNKEPSVLFNMVYQSCLNKKQVVEIDPTEKGERALLNLGHTLGHAVEKLCNFQMLHGECVAIGTAGAAYLSRQRGYLSKEDFEDIISVLKLFHLPTQVSGLNRINILEATKHDKKMEAGKIRFILLKEIGNAYIDTQVTEKELFEAIDYMNR